MTTTPVFPNTSQLAPLTAKGRSTLWKPLAGSFPALTATALFMLALMVPSALAWLIDTRLFNGISVWVKPMKFEFSVAIHLLTISWLGALLPAAVRDRQFVRRLIAALIVAGLFEVLYIAFQASRGEASHFNQSSPAGIILYSMMGVGALVLVVATAILGYLTLRHGDRHNPLVFGAGWGLILGGLLGGLTGAYLGAQTGHWVGGTPSDAAGLPIVGWSRDGGDLRAAHFMGLHLMQILPVTAWVLSQWVNAHTNRSIVIGVAIIGTALTAVLFVQATMGRPMLGL